MTKPPLTEGQSLPPRYEHDCPWCVFLGQHEDWDLYACPNEPTLVARRSDEGSDYYSGTVPVEMVATYVEQGGGMGALAEARRRVRLLARAVWPR